MALLRPPSPGRLAFLADPDKPGTATSAPAEVDRLAREAWGRIYHGNITDPEANAVCFMHSFGQWATHCPVEEFEDNEPWQ
eukprot:13711638-Alexandrium_andersonii.AAC.1